MPAGIGFRAAEMSHGLLFLFGGHTRSFARIEADKNNFVIAPRIEAEHAQHADNALLNLIAEQGTSVVNEGEDDRFLLTEIVAKSNAAAGFVAEREVQRHLPIERRLEPDVLQNRGLGRGRRAGAARNSLRPQRRASGPKDTGTRGHQLGALLRAPYHA